MNNLVDYQLGESFATLSMDDGKVNVLSPAMLQALNERLDQAQRDKAVVLLTGRPGVFTAGFDLSVLRGGGEEASKMVRAGFDLAERLLSYPAPVVLACSGHALAMGAFLLLSADIRIGAAGQFKIGANEVAIGLTMPHFGIEICRQRLTPAHFNRAVINAEMFPPDQAVSAGFLDRIVPAADLLAAGQDAAKSLAKLNMAVHTATKLRTRAHALKAIREAIDADSFLTRG
ncbi:MAG: crotonase/enoyl-CoA hydratase family protein [Steroidobacteraceae bacterium]